MPPRRTWPIAFCFSCVTLAAGPLGSSPAPADKPETWVEITSPHFIVMSDDGDRTARRIAQQFEQIRVLYSKALSPNLRLDPGIPIVIIAARNEKSLSQILPEFWAQKGHTHPAGLFLPGPERNFVALRTDVEGEFPYLPLYHEYVHLIVNLNFQHIPLWLNEGYATFLGSATLLPKSGHLGQPNESELYVLQQAKLLPLETLFRVGHDSPYYNEAEKTNIFYAESWALVHLLMTDPSRQKGAQIGKYIALVERGGDPLDSARTAFGDLAQLKKQLDSYVSRTSYTMFAIDLPDPIDPKTFSTRILPTADVDATLGEFDVSRRQLDSARTKIEEAMRLDPNLAAAQEGMGLLLFREGNRGEAQKYFSRAVALDSNSALTYFYDGMLLVSGEADQEDADEAQAALEKAVALKPELAPAWDALAGLYVSDPAAMDKALNAAHHAVNAMPGEPRYRFNLAVVLLKMDKFEEARAALQGFSRSQDQVLAAQADDLLAQIDRSEQFSSSKQGDANRSDRVEIDRGAPGAPVMKRKALDQPEPSDDTPRGSGRDTASSSGQPPAVNSKAAYSMMGTVAMVNCTNAPQMELTLQSAGIVMRLHTSDLATIEIKSATEKPACPQFSGKRARISYQLTAGKSWDGEIVSVEIQSAH